MTIGIKFRLVRTTPLESATRVEWVVGVSDGERSSTGTGVCELTQSLAGMTDDQIIEAALNGNGGAGLVDWLYDFHSENLKRNVCAEVIDDWYVAYQFFCSKTGGQPLDKATCLSRIKDGTGLFEVMYSHSVYNLTEQQQWSNTFWYTQEGVGLRHIKVHGGAVVDWYTHKEDLTYNGIPVVWTADDLVTGDVIEYYVGVPNEDGTLTLNKYSAADNSLLTVIQHQNGNQLPQDFADRLVGLPFADRVFGFGSKPYGDVVEYTIAE